MTTASNAELWYVVHTQPNKELLVAGLLEERLSLEVYLPEVLQTYRGKLQPRPFFPRYLFVHADLAVTEMSAINYSPGVLKLVSYGDMPQPVQAELVTEIRSRIDRLNGEGGMPQHQFQPGDHVRLVGGPLAGLEAVFQGPMKPSERVKILLDFLGTLRETEVPVELLELASPNHIRRGRTTRGRGRRIHNHSQSVRGSML